MNKTLLAAALISLMTVSTRAQSDNNCSGDQLSLECAMGLVPKDSTDQEKAKASTNFIRLAVERHSAEQAKALSALTQLINGESTHGVIPRSVEKIFMGKDVRDLALRWEPVNVGVDNVLKDLDFKWYTDKAGLDCEGHFKSHINPEYFSKLTTQDRGARPVSIKDFLVLTIHDVSCR